MEWNEFSLLDEKQKIDCLYNEGVYIGKRKRGNTTVILYQLGAFYIEVFYIKYRRNITSIRYIKSTSILDHYLEQITLENLLTHFEV